MFQVNLSAIWKPWMRRSIQRSFLWTAIMVMASMSQAAMIVGDKGNKPVGDPGWPTGAAAVFNVPSRIAWWEGPPFGGGQWHSECQGDAKIVNQVLKDFAKVDSPGKRIVLRDGVGKSFWLDMNNEKKNDRSVEVDFVLMVWVKDRWDFQKKLPPGLTAIRGEEVGRPLVELTIYTGGDVQWSEVSLPDGLEVIDERLEAHGFQISDGRVIEGVITDDATGRPIQAKVKIEQRRVDEGGAESRYVATQEFDTDTEGHWSIRNVDDATSRIVISAPDYAPRVVSYFRFDFQPGWSFYPAALAKLASLQGRIVDHEGRPLEDVDVRLDNLVGPSGENYELPQEWTVKSGKNGEFEFTNIPEGKATIWVHKQDYVRPGLGLDVQIPSVGNELTMGLAGRITIQVVSSGMPLAENYIVQVESMEGAKVGTWGGSAQLDSDGSVKFTDVPPGRYKLHGRPNPGSVQEQTEDVTIEVLGGKETKIILKAKSL